MLCLDQASLRHTRNHAAQRYCAVYPVNRPQLQALQTQCAIIQPNTQRIHQPPPCQLDASKMTMIMWPNVRVDAPALMSRFCMGWQKLEELQTVPASYLGLHPAARPLPLLIMACADSRKVGFRLIQNQSTGLSQILWSPLGPWHKVHAPCETCVPLLCKGNLALGGVRKASFIRTEACFAFLRMQTA